MLERIGNLLEKTNDIKRSAYLWNAINAILSALQSPVILMVITRTTGVYDAGVFSIAFAVASLMLYVGLYGIRRFQASDIHEKYSFPEYQGMRFITCGAMIAASFVYCIYGLGFRHYSFEKAAIVFVICLIKLIQSYTDVVHGNMQQKDRLDVATKCSSLRYVMEVLALCVGIVLTRSLLLSCVICLAVSVIFMFLTTMNVGRRYCSTYRPGITIQRFKRLAADGFPIFISLFLNMYISNAPKYAIDAYLTEKVQAIYNIIFMPAFMVMLIANFIFNPILTSYAELWLSGTREKFRQLMKNIRRQMLVILGLTLLGLLVAYTIGIPVLARIFGLTRILTRARILLPGIFRLSLLAGRRFSFALRAGVRRVLSRARISLRIRRRVFRVSLRPGGSFAAVRVARRVATGIIRRFGTRITCPFLTAFGQFSLQSRRDLFPVSGREHVKIDRGHRDHRETEA